MTFVKKDTSAPIGSKGTEVVVGAAAAELKKAANSIVAATESVQTLADRVDQLTLQITNKENELKGLQVKFVEDERTRTLDLELKMKERSAQTTAEFLESQGKVAIAKDELQQLKDDLKKLQTEFKADVNSSVAGAVAAARTEFNAEKNLLSANNDKNNAELTFNVKSLQAQLDAAKEQNKLLLDQLTAEREAGVKRAEASAIGAVNINNGRQ